MSLSSISRLGGGLNLPNKTYKNAGEEVYNVTEDTPHVLDEKETRLVEKQKDVVESACTYWVGGYKNNPLSVEAEEDRNKEWYSFLDDLYKKFSEYVVQKDRQKYNVADLEDWGQSGKPQGIVITPKMFKTFLNKIESYNVKEYENIKKMKETTGSQIDELNQVLSLTLNYTPTAICSGTDILVKGNFIVLSEIMRNLISKPNVINSCTDIMSQFETGKYNVLKVLAYNTVFIDDDLMFAGKGISVAVIAPKWEIVGSRRIDLNGADGATPAELKAKNGAHPGNNGTNGVPGNPGASGESFFGIGSTFVGGEKLKILSNGGNGGSGQAGGDGAPGMPGEDAITPAPSDPPCENFRFREFTCEKVRTKDESGWGIHSFSTIWKIRGIDGGGGGDGGDGGTSGKGGDPGRIAILELSQPSKIQNLTSKGKEGDIGRGGVGGHGGKNGNSVEGDYTHIVKMGGGTVKKWYDVKTLHNFNIGSRGRNGTDGGNRKDVKDPVPASGIHSLARIVTEYTFYLRENMNNRFQKCALLQFLDLLNSNNDVRKLYDLLALFQEFQDLEEQLPKLREQRDFSHFYSSLLERIKAFAEGQKDIPNSNDSRKVLNYLYTATLGRINNFKENTEQHLIINLREYLDMVERNIKSLEKTKEISNKVDVVNKYKENYKSGIDTKIKEAQSLIKNQINPEMDKINARIDEEIGNLIEETITLQKQAKKDWEKLREKKEELKKVMATKGLFNCLKIMGGVVNFLGPVGAITGTVIDAASTVGESLALNDQGKILNIPTDIETSLTTLKSQIETMRDNKVDYLSKILKNISKEIKKNPEKLGDIKDKISKIENKLQEVSSKEIEYKEVGGLEKQLEGIIKEKGKFLKSHTKDKKSLDALKAIEKITQVVQFGSLFATIYGEMKEDKEKLDVLSQSMDDMTDKIIMLKEYEKDIYDTMAPMLHRMEEHMKDVSDKLGTKSRVALDVTKWQVQSSLKDMKTQMQQLTEGHDVKGDLSRSIDKLDEVMTTLINVYDRIQSYQDQQNLANYIADISSVAANSINVKNMALGFAVNSLDNVIKTNIVLEQYKSAIGALKQLVFPFEDLYIEKRMLPSYLDLDKSIESLVLSATRKIDKIKDKLDLYEDSITKGDENFECEEFSSRYVSSRPFYLWRNEENRGSISSLLSGKEVVLKADVLKSAPHKDAIKFSEIEFDFKIKNATAQSLLSEVLKGFDMRATHLGNSYYRYHDRITLITSDSVTFSYSYEKDGDGNPIRSNRVYERLKSGDILLSPYTFWKVEMISQTSQYSFRDLEKYKNEVDVELAGIGSYVDARVNRHDSFTMENNEILPLFKRRGAGLGGCKRSRYRSTRSLKETAEHRDFMTSDASKGMSSPINFLFNFAKTYFVSNVVISINRVFFGQQKSVRKDFSESHHNPPTVRDAEDGSSGNTCTREGIEGNSDVVFDFNFIHKSGRSKSFLLSDQNYSSREHSVQSPDLNCSLLLADLVTRTITRNGYKKRIDECLLSPRERMFCKIRDGIVRKESEVIRILQRHLSETEEKRPSSLLSKLNGYAKSMLQRFGLMGTDATQEYIQDIRHLFA